LPTTVTHAVLAGAAAKTFGERENPLRLWCAAVAVSILPDADVLGFSFGVNYGDFLGHRGFFHSPFFSLVLSVLCVSVLFRHHRPFRATWWKYVAFLSVVGASHGVLDAFTDGGLGIALLAPFDNTRYFAAWRPIPVAPIALRPFLGGWGLQVIFWEIAYLCVPMCVALAGFMFIKSRRRGERQKRQRA
jgi:inner membrane protein